VWAAVAWHGCHRRLSDAELAETYGDGEWWGCAALRKQQRSAPSPFTAPPPGFLLPPPVPRARAARTTPPTPQPSLRHEGFTVWLSYFDLPGVPLTARLVDLCDRSAAPAAAAAAYPFVPDVLAAFNAAFDFTHFAAGTGGYFSALQADPDRCPPSPHLNAPLPPYGPSGWTERRPEGSVSPPAAPVWPGPGPVSRKALRRDSPPSDGIAFWAPGEFPGAGDSYPQSRSPIP